MSDSEGAGKHKHSSHKHRRHHRHRTESLSKQKRRTRLRYLAGALALAAAFGIVMIAVSLMERRENTDPNNTGTASQNSRGTGRIWADVDTVDFDQGLFGFDHRMESFLFVGTDNSGNENPEEGEEYHGAMADFLLLMVLDYTADSYGFLQIDRNTVTPVEMLGTKGEYWGDDEMQICVSHWYGGSKAESAENTVTAVSTLLGYLENIRGYYILNMDDVGVLNRAVGGVEVTIEDDLSPTDPDLKQGSTLTLTDEQAERYFRARMGVGGGTNAERMQRQRAYMSSFFAKVGNLTRQNAGFYNQLWNDIRHTGQTNMNGNSFSRIANMLLKGEDKGMFTLDGASTEGYILGDGELHEEFYPSENAIFDVMNELFPLIPIAYEQLEDWEEDTEETEVWENEFYVSETDDWEYETDDKSITEYETDDDSITEEETVL